MGRPVIKQASVKGQSFTSSPVIDFYPRSTVTWRSTIVSSYPYQWTVSGQHSAAAMTWVMYVNGRDVTEFCMARSFGESSILVIPWLDGLRFSSGERVGWMITASSQIWASACFIGAAD